MSRKERDRMVQLGRVEKGELRLVEAAEILGTSYRQCQRHWARYKEFGAAGLIHRGRGRPSNRRLSGDLREAILARYDERYPDFGPTLAAEKLLEDGFVIDHETLRRLLAATGRWKRRRKRSSHRSWRERRHHFGEMVQMDGSHHRWFEERGGESCLMDMTDDATSKKLALMSEEETTESAMRLLWKWIELYGIPGSIYVDRKTIFVVDEKSRERARDEGREALTQFGRACRKLGIEIITANSPQAKGRIERAHGVYQDRFVKELRLRGIDTIEGATELLENGFVEGLNKKFAVKAIEAADYHRSAEGYDLAAIFSIEEERTVSADWIVRFENRFFQLKPHNKRLRGNGKVTVSRRLDSTLHFYFRDQEIVWEELPERPQPASPKKGRKRGSQTIMTKYIPPRDNPWRRFVINPGRN
jgi:hypothetical protein